MQAQLHPITHTQGQIIVPAYLRRKEAANYLSISLGTLDSLVKRGLLPVIRPSPGVVLLRRTDLDEALNRFRVSSIVENQR